MSTEKEQEPTMITMTESHLRKIFQETKSHDLTETDFEKNKTQRITALCNALTTAVGTEREYIVQMLKSQIETQYQSS